MEWFTGKTKVPIANWAKDIEEGAMIQAENLADLDFVHHHVALMPDCHQGYGMPIGGVIACKGKVIPNAVGVDIGCGMGFVHTNIPADEVKQIRVKHQSLIKVIVKTLFKAIPTGKNHHRAPQECPLLDNPPKDVMEIEVVKDQINRAKYQIGTLGGGNHFIDIMKNDKGELCIMLHSGSRNFGYRIAKHFNAMAQALGGFKYRGEDGLAELDVESDTGKQYLTAMQYALDFAKENRRRMMEKTKNVVFNLIQKHAPNLGADIEIFQEVNAHHNYASLERHYGEDVWVHRKGAICVPEGVFGIIPGSMGTSSYIVKGKGSEESFCSASHGAGRVMGRNQFNKQYSLEQAEERMASVEHLGWPKNRKGNFDFSESPEAYKDIDEVIAAESDLVDIEMRLTPLGVVTEQ